MLFHPIMTGSLRAAVLAILPAADEFREGTWNPAPGQVGIAPALPAWTGGATSDKAAYALVRVERGMALLAIPAAFPGTCVGLGLVEDGMDAVARATRHARQQHATLRQLPDVTPEDVTDAANAMVEPGDADAIRAALSQTDLTPEQVDEALAITDLRRSTSETTPDGHVLAILSTSLGIAHSMVFRRTEQGADGGNVVLVRVTAPGEAPPTDIADGLAEAIRTGVMDVDHKTICHATREGTQNHPIYMPMATQPHHHRFFATWSDAMAHLSAAARPDAGRARAALREWLARDLPGWSRQRLEATLDAIDADASRVDTGQASARIVLNRGFVVRDSGTIAFAGDFGVETLTWQVDVPAGDTPPQDDLERLANHDDTDLAEFIRSKTPELRQRPQRRTHDGSPTAGAETGTHWSTLEGALAFALGHVPAQPSRLSAMAALAWGRVPTTVN